jgi:hypothetical protein
MKKWYQHLFPPDTISGKWLRALGAFAGISLVMIVLLEGTFAIPQARANAVIASDSFNRTASNGWGTASSGGSWTVLDTPTSWSVTPGAGSINAGDLA